jgi:hypothetical protein
MTGGHLPLQLNSLVLYRIQGFLCGLCAIHGGRREPMQMSGMGSQVVSLTKEKISLPYAH